MPPVIRRPEPSSGSVDAVVPDWSSVCVHGSATSGEVLKEATGHDGAFVFAVIRDPAGATLALVPA